MFAVLRIALRALRRNILRSFLTMLGIIVGIAAVIVGVSMGTGAKAEVDKQIAGMGQNLLVVMSGNMARGGRKRAFWMDEMHAWPVVSDRAANDQRVAALVERIIPPA
jgi:ABC-type antimicrobial peptide transport system permease subunit